MNGKSGDVILTEGLQGEDRSSLLFVRHLEELHCTLRCYPAIHVILDNAKFDDSVWVHVNLAAQGDRIVLHSLPKHAQWSNPIERIRWHLHEEIIRSH